MLIRKEIKDRRIMNHTIANYRGLKKVGRLLVVPAAEASTSTEAATAATAAEASTSTEAAEAAEARRRIPPKPPQPASGHIHRRPDTDQIRDRIRLIAVVMYNAVSPCESLLCCPWYSIYHCC